jgi:hypothetical protein
MLTTKLMLDQLRADRARNVKHLDYTMGGPIGATVVSSVEAQRERKINQGERTLQNALQKMRTDQSFSSREGLAKAHFNHSKQEIKP